MVRYGRNLYPETVLWKKLFILATVTPMDMIFIRRMSGRQERLLLPAFRFCEWIREVMSLPYGDSQCEYSGNEAWPVLVTAVPLKWEPIRDFYKGYIYLQGKSSGKILWAITFPELFPGENKFTDKET